MFERVGSDSPWEAVVGYSRVVRADRMVYVAGTTAADAEGRVAAPGDAYTQTVHALRKVEAALGRVGARLEHVVRTRIYVTEISRWEEVGRAHGEFFRDIRPAATMVEVSRLIHPDMLVEVEAEAVLPDGGAGS